MNPFNGIRVIESAYAVKKGTPYAVRRTWRARLLTWPWRPWISSTLVTPMVPCFYQTPQGFICHPAIVQELRRTFNAPRPGGADR